MAWHRMAWHDGHLQPRHEGGVGLGAMAAAPDKQQEAAQPSFGHMDTAALSQMNDI